MKKIYYNKREIIFCQPSEVPVDADAVYMCENTQQMIKAFRIFTADETVNNLYLVSENNPKEMRKMFAKEFKVVKAGGGLVKNPEGKFLFIFRNGKWDLPKGKRDSKEEPMEQTATREVQEETGLQNPIIEYKLSSTYHFALNTESLILKKCYWYAMKSDTVAKLIPQTEEGIDQVLWADENQIAEFMKNTYKSIEDVWKNYKQ